MKRVAIVSMPGSNCESESERVCRAVGLAPEVFRWNRAPRELAAFDAAILPGGFAFEDRVRAGALAAKLPIMDAVTEMAAAGKAVVGICNGAQILVEAGLVPGLAAGEVEMALAPNENGRGGYDCRWIRVARGPGAKRSVLTCAVDDEVVIPMPFGHGEGRFVTRDESLLNELAESGQILLRYVDDRGEAKSDVSTNPNGSAAGIAALGNREGNVAAIMPHPERGAWLYQVPEGIGGAWGERRRAAHSARDLDAPGPGRALFESLRRFLEER